MSDVGYIISRILDAEIPTEYRDAVMSSVLVEAMNKKPKSLLLVGPPGTGKTYQAWAAYRESRGRQLTGKRTDDLETFASNPGAMKAGAYETDKGFKPTLQIITEAGHIMRFRNNRAWLDEIANHEGWLIIDDIGAVGVNDWLKESIYHIATERRAWELPTLWSTNLSLDDLATVYTPAIASRLTGGEVLNLSGDDRRQA